MNNSDIKSLDKELKRLDNFSDLIGTAIVNRNGLLVSSRMPRDIDERKLGALSATMFEAIETATSGFSSKEIRNLSVEYKDYQIIILGLGPNMILVSLIDAGTNLGLILIELEEAIKNIKSIIEK
ncbi:MAG: roadblock/LC7 domain-containing protein [Promethearchaeota archaeon]